MIINVHVSICTVPHPVGEDRSGKSAGPFCLSGPVISSRGSSVPLTSQQIILRGLRSSAVCPHIPRPHKNTLGKPVYWIKDFLPCAAIIGREQEHNKWPGRLM